MQESSGFLTGKFLIATPAMENDQFNRAVVLVCGHDKNGAMGLVLNRSLPDVTLSDLLENLKIQDNCDSTPIKIHFGGPVEGGRGFVLHGAEYKHEASVKVLDNVFLTATADILRALVNGTGPKDVFIALGYAGWDAGQLDQELLSNGWLVSDANLDIIFNSDLDLKWAKSLAEVGIKPEMLSLEGGHA